MSDRQFERPTRRRPLARWVDRQLVGLWLVVAFIGFFFVYPLGQVLVLSLTDRTGGLSLSSFQQLLADATIRQVLVQTTQTSLTVSLICLLVAYPAACYLARLTGWKSTLCNVLILFPFLSSSLVRTFVFIVLLGRRGVVNQFLEYLGVPGTPFR